MRFYYCFDICKSYSTVESDEISNREKNLSGKKDDFFKKICHFPEENCFSQ